MSWENWIGVIHCVYQNLTIIAKEGKSKGLISIMFMT